MLKQRASAAASAAEALLEKIRRRGKTLVFLGAIFLVLCSDSAGYLTRAQAAGARINILGGAVNDSLYTLYVGLPSTIAPTMRVGDLDTKRHAFPTAGTLSHFAAPPRVEVHNKSSARLL